MAYHVPLYDRFRVGARHLILASFALTVLAAFGLAALRRGELSRRALYSALVCVLVTLAAVACAIAGWPTGFELDTERGLPWALPIWPGAVWIELLIAVATTAILGLVARTRRRAMLAVLMVLVACDLLLAVSYGLESGRIDATRIPGAAIRPSVHAARLATDLAPRHQRLLASGRFRLRAATVQCCWPGMPPSQ
jgi:uncharacterized membrane protein